ncbi:hypothetical protein RHMOL_Rhmol06G0127200 [Rhododendron molle]|uniref:Uncharacterized protein n=1 Tax=Rhododendron molle TaxID=49168 RepID=A0ACC0NBM4_RHOML|nr:hypothetical protein RHMOL_Rhmol06G0127200 [Rhododendron molle]
MADGTVNMAEGLGFKAIDSNEMRRKQKNISDQISSTQSGNPISSFPCELGDLRSNNPSEFNRPSSSTGLGILSPTSSKNPSPSRKLQQAFFKERLILEAEERALHEHLQQQSQ